MEVKADIGLIGLAVMGQNLVLNMNDHGYSVAVYNRTTSRVDEFLKGPAEGRKNIYGVYSIEELVDKLARPRKIMLMVKAGEVVDKLIDSLIHHLDKGDLIIDGGNSHFLDTTRRTKELDKEGILFIGTGVSGGEEGARHGPSLMPGGNPGAWPLVKDIFQAISARAPDGAPCCEWMGEDGAGHYIKMVHNGIEYGDMQLICEAYQLMKTGLGMSPDEMSRIFKEWDKGELNSFLIEITGNILSFKDEDGSPLVEKILDTAGQKGTGKWTGISALDMGSPVTLIVEAVFARCLSALKEERVKASRILKGPDSQFKGNPKSFTEDIRKALFASKLISYAQGFMLLREAGKEYGWNLDFGSIASVWRGGCIIRSSFLGKIKEAFDRNPYLQNLLLDDYFKGIIAEYQLSWRKVVGTSIELGVSVPAFSSALSFYDGYRSDRLPASLLQAQRDYFGAHTYERVDRPRGQFFHTNWTGRGGEVSSGTYNV
ncbi:MAG: phosphogluconate dehydrogenase (NADP(+)-dependent, decarboxylating) [Spirochaetes bacterium]|nr:MAG: phosphogluconate dehydrogenase (NADP(+)-dependent, decarboxylating) [Spirochaetota bacterium]